MDETAYADFSQEELNKEAKRQLRRIKRFVKAATQRGYTFSKTAIPTLPKKILPKTVARLYNIRPTQLYKKSVYVSPEGVKIKGYKRRAQERSEASKKAYATRKSYATARSAYTSLEPSTKTMASAIPNEAEMVIENIRAAISTVDDLQFVMDNREINDRWWEHKRDPLGHYKERDFGLLRAALDKALSMEGYEAVAARIQENSTRLSDLVSSVLYDSGDKYHRTGRDGMNAKIQEIGEILLGHNLSSRESMEITSMGEWLGLHES